MLDTHARKYVQPSIELGAKLLIGIGCTANQVTWAAFFIGVLSGPLIYFGYAWCGIALLWISGFLDAIDGTIARKENKTSAWGTVLDITFDRIVELSVIVGLAAAYVQAQWLLLLLTASIVISMTIFLTVGALSDKSGVKSFYYQAGLAERTEGFLLLSIMALLPEWIRLSTALFVFVELFTAMQRLLEAKRLLSGGKDSK